MSNVRDMSKLVGQDLQYLEELETAQRTCEDAASILEDGRFRITFDLFTRVGAEMYGRHCKLQNEVDLTDEEKDMILGIINRNKDAVLSRINTLEEKYESKCSCDSCECGEPSTPQEPPTTENPDKPSGGDNQGSGSIGEVEVDFED